MITDLNTQATTRGLNGVEIGSGGDTEAMFHWLGIGPPNQMRYDQLGYMGYPVTTPDLPRAYLGRAIKLETSLHHTVVTRNDFYTELLPLEYTNDLNINVTILNFTNTILEIEPYGGNSRYITSNIEQKSDKLLRRGIAFEIAHEFWKTQEGLQHYFMNFRVLESSTLMTIYFNIIFALLKHGNLYRDWEYKYANKALTIEEAAHLSKQKFGLLNKGMKEFRTYHARLTDYMKLNDCKPTHWVLPPGSKILMTHMHDSETEFYRAGSNALENREKGQEAASYLRGVKICETDLFEQQIVGDDPNPLTRLAEYGSFFVITNHWGSSHLDTYRSDERYAAMIMDASKDGLERKVVARDLFDLCFRFEGKGELSKYHQILADGDTIDDISKRLGHNPENRHIDMFIGVDNTKPAKHRNYVMQYIGEMYEKDLDKATLRNFAITACNSLQLSPEEIGMMRETKHFMDDLNSPDVNSNEFRAYIMAIALSGMPGGENYGGATDILKDNGEGCIMPPPIIPNEGLGCVINGTPTPLLFARRDGRWAAISRAAAAAANDADTYAAMGLPNFQGPQANPADPFTQLQNGRVLADDGLLFRVMKCIPYGFGSPTGLRTLSRMYTKKDYRGYDENLLEQAHKHYTILQKFFTVWKKIFPHHELGDERACPVYFKTKSTNKNEVTAFCLNLYDHNRFPFYIIPPAKVENHMAYIFDTTQANSVLMANAGTPERLIHILTTEYIRDLTQEQIQALTTRLTVATRATSSLALEELLRTPNPEKILKTMSDQYRGKPYTNDDGRNLSFADFLRFILASDWDANHNLAIINKFAAVVEVLTAPKSASGQIVWKTVLTAAQNKPTKIRRQTPELPQQHGTPDHEHVNAILSRLCLNPTFFHTLADMVSAVHVNQQTLNDFTSLVTYPIRPMNIFSPTHPLGLYADDGTTPQRGINANEIRAIKDVMKNMKYAAAPIDGNTLSALTISPAMSRHIDKNDIDGISEMAKKRSPVDELSSASGSSNKRRRLFGGIPLAHTTYGRVSHLDTDPDPSETIPMNIAIDFGFKIFTKLHERGLPENMQAPYFRENVVIRFYDAAQEIDDRIRIFLQSVVTSRIHKEVFINFYDQHCAPIVAFQLFRPRQTYKMGAGILMQGGIETGVTYHGNYDFRWMDDAMSKKHVGHFTMHSTCTIKKPKNIAIVPNIVAQGYVRGESVTFCRTTEDVKRMLTSPADAPGDIIVKMVPVRTGLPSSPQDIAGKWNRTITLQAQENLNEPTGLLHGESVYYYALVLSLDKINYGIASNLQTTFLNPIHTVNTLCYLGHHRLYDPGSKQWRALILDDGPFGSNIYKGVISHRSMCGHPIKEMEWEKTHTILAA